MKIVIFQSLQTIHTSLAPNHPLRKPVDSILQRVPTELRSRMERRAAPNAPSPVPSMKALIRLHIKVNIDFIPRFLLSSCRVL